MQGNRVEKHVSGAEVAEQLLSGAPVLLPPLDVMETLKLLRSWQLPTKAIILDSWYNKGFGGVRLDYQPFILSLLAQSAELAEHVFLWGFPEIVAQFVDKLPPALDLVAWLTWYYKNNPSVIRGWRSSQNACLHLARPGAQLYPEHFMNDAQKRLKDAGKLRYMPGPTTVIEAEAPVQTSFLAPTFQPQADVIEDSLLVGFVGKKERTGHPSQKPIGVIEKLILMTTVEGELVIDPMAGSGTTGAAAAKLGRRALLADHLEDYVQMMEARLQIRRTSLE